MSKTAALKVIEPLLKNRLLLVTKQSCPFCQRAIQLSESKGVPPTVLEISKRPDGASIQDALAEMTKQRTVPFVFANGEFQGGCSDLERQPSQFWAALKQ